MKGSGVMNSRFFLASLVLVGVALLGAAFFSMVFVGFFWWKELRVMLLC